jgi:hypothetical protein
MSWALTAQPIPPDTWPGSIPGVISTALSPYVIPVNLLNNITSSEPLVFYFTPVFVGGATLINPGADPKLHNLDVSAGCYVVGATQVLTLVPVLEPIEGLATATPATFGQNNGAVALTINGGYPAAANNPALYQVLWNTGATSAALYNVGPGTYSVTVSDPSGCTNSITLTADVTVPVKEQATVIHLDIQPNPSAGMVLFTLLLQTAADLEIEVLNPLGQVVYYHKAMKITTLEHNIDLRPFPDGLYLLKVVADGQTTLRKVVLQR